MQTLCTNCDNNQSCNWKNEHITQCNEHVTSTVETIVLAPEKSTLKTRQISLCDTCLHNNACVFKQQELKTIFCEEYQ